MDYQRSVLIRRAPLPQFVAEFRDTERIGKFCCQCLNYARSWACPPLSEDMSARPGSYTYVTLVASCYTPNSPGMLIADFRQTIMPEIQRLEHRMRAIEPQCDGYTFGNIGGCRLCPEVCRRPDGLACAHPDLVRPSLEAYGFDVTSAVNRLFGIEMRWSTDGFVPEYLVFVNGLFHNRPFDTDLLTARCVSRNIVCSQ